MTTAKTSRPASAGFLQAVPSEPDQQAAQAPQRTARKATARNAAVIMARLPTALDYVGYAV